MRLRPNLSALLPLLLGALLHCANTAYAQPTLSEPDAVTIFASQVTLELRSNKAGTGYVTLLEGSAAMPGTSAQTKAGRDSQGRPATRFGSLHLAANTTGRYTVRDLKAGTSYLVCFTADDGAKLQPEVKIMKFATAAATDAVGCAWREIKPTPLSAGSAYFTRLAVAPDGSLYVAYSDGAYAGKATVRRFDGSGWSIVGAAGISAGLAEYLSLSFAPDGTPFLAFQDWANQKAATVLKFDGAAWVAVGTPGFHSSATPFTTLAFAPDGAPWIAYQYWGKATVMRFDGVTWVIVGRTEFSSGVAKELSLAFAPNGVPHLAFVDASRSYRTTVMKFNGTDWAFVGAAGFSPHGGAVHPCLKFSPSGVAHLAFGYSGFPAALMKFDGVNWIAVGGVAVSSDTALAMDLAFTPDDVPVVAYIDFARNQRATVMQFRNAQWTPVAQAGISQGDADFTSLALTPDGRPFLTYSDFGTAAAATVLGYVPPTSYADWVSTNFTLDEQADPAISGPAADPDAGGLPNLLRFALDRPAESAAGSPVAPLSVTHDGQAYGALQFTRRPIAPGLRYVVQASTDLDTWETVSTWPAGLPAVVEARDHVPLGTGPRRFLRLAVSLH